MRFIPVLFLSVLFIFPVKAKDPKPASKTTRQELSWLEKRKFDYFFLEGIRLKEAEKHTDAYETFKHALAIDSTSSVALYEISNYYLYLNDGMQAFKLLKKAVQYNPDNFEYKISLANVARGLNIMDESIAIYEDLIKKYPDKPELNYNLSNLYAQSGEIDKAIKALDVLENDIGMSEALSLQKFRLYNMIEQRDQAFNEIEKLSAKYLAEPKYQIIMGDLYLEQKNPDKALLCYQKAHDIDPSNPYYIVSMANYYEYKQDKEAAEKEIDTALRNPKLDVETKLDILSRYIQTLVQGKKDMEAANSLFETLMDQHSQEKELNLMYGQFLLTQGKLEEAKFQFQVVTEATPDNLAAWRQLLGISIKEEKLDDCIDICNKALVHFPDAPEFYFYKGGSYYQKKEYAKALEVFQEGLQKAPTDDPSLTSDFYGQIGDLYYHLGEKDKSYEAYEKALQFSEKNIGVLNNYAYFLTLDKKELGKAERMSAQCIKMQPDNPTYLDTYAWVLFTQGNYSLSKFYIERAISQEGEKSGEVLDHYGDILFFSGDIEKAVEQWKKALEMKEKESENTDVIKKKIADKKYYENAN